MLVISRQRHEEIVIGRGADAIVISIVDIRGDKVRIGIEANRSVPVHRREVYEAIESESERRLKIERRVSNLERFISTVWICRAS